MQTDYDNHGNLKDRMQNNRNLVPNLVTQITRPDTITSGTTKPGSVVEFINSTMGATQITVGIGDDIQNAINNAHSRGGGIINVQNGFHSVQNDIILYSNVTLQGQNALSTIIDFGGKNYSLKIWGTAIYSTGTVTVTSGSSTVTGSGTTWTSAMNGYEISLQGVYYSILSVNSATSITLTAPFLGSNIAGQAYSIDSPISDVKLASMTVQNSSGNNIDIRHSSIVFLDVIASLYGGYGMYVNFADALIVDRTEIIGCGYGSNINNSGSLSLGTFFVNYTSVGYGMNLNNVFSSTIINWSSEGCVGNGISLTGCWEVDFLSGNTNNNGGKGVEFISGNVECVLNSHSSFNNASDGFKLTATDNYCQLVSCQANNNTGWGINIANANCTGNILNGNTYVGNTSGTYTNSGTSTRIF